VDCDSSRIQDCNGKRVKECLRETEASIAEQEEEPVFCFLKGVLKCSPGRVQDCNIKHTDKCMLEEDK
jgi:hypothetical protein